MREEKKERDRDRRGRGKGEGGERRGEERIHYPLYLVLHPCALRMKGRVYVLISKRL
jgi:hypothetical protein